MSGGGLTWPLPVRSNDDKIYTNHFVVHLRVFIYGDDFGTPGIIFRRGYSIVGGCMVPIRSNWRGMMTKPDSDGYPTEGELQSISDWDPRVWSVVNFLDFIESIWWNPEWGFVKKGKRIIVLELHTGGWSGNESIISALNENKFFYPLYWQHSKRGGHLKFRIPLMEIKKEADDADAG